MRDRVYALDLGWGTVAAATPLNELAIKVFCLLLLQVDEVLALLLRTLVQILFPFDDVAAFADVMPDRHLLYARARVLHRLLRLHHAVGARLRAAGRLINLRPSVRPGRHRHVAAARVRGATHVRHTAHVSHIAHVTGGHHRHVICNGKVQMQVVLVGLRCLALNNKSVFSGHFLLIPK